MHDQILKALERSPADYTEIRLERAWRTEVLYQGDSLENLETSSEQGGIVRSLVDGGWGIAVFNSLEDLEQRVEDAHRIARVVSARITERVELAPVEPIQDEVRVALEKDPRSVALRHKQALLQGYNETMLKYDNKIVATYARYTDAFKEITIANSEGAFIVEERPDVTLLFVPIARQGDTNIQRALEMYGRAAGFEAVEGREEMAETGARRALELLKAKPVKGGVYTVILDQMLGGVFIHEAFGHLCEADNIHKHQSLQEILQPGRKFGMEELNVIDDGYLPGARGNSKYDDEGTPRQKTYLIKNGVLQGFLHSRETAAHMGAQPTGNARAISYRHAPIVRMRNTYIDNGSATFQEMLKGIDRGIYACGSLGGQEWLEQFTFSAERAYEIVNGQLGDMLRDAVLTGNVFETLKNIDMIGNDLVICNPGAGCGKSGQYQLPVTQGSPHVRIQNVTIGGAA